MAYKKITSIFIFLLWIPAVFSNDIFSSPVGLSGSILTPSPFVMRNEEGSISYHANFFETKDSSTLTESMATRHLISFSAGVLDNMEVAFAQEFLTGAATKERKTWWSLKYHMPSDSLPISFAFVMPASQDDYAAALSIFGWKPFHFGFGTNFGGKKLTEINVLSGGTFGRAFFGGYRMKRVPSTTSQQPNVYEMEGEPDSVFAFAGGQVNLGKNVQWLYDYDGDVFASGFRFTIDTSTFQLGYLSTGDYDNLYGRKQTNFTASAMYKF